MTRVKTQSPTWRQRGRSLLREIAELKERVPKEGEYFVRCAAELVEQLRREPSQPVTLLIETVNGGELQFVATRSEAVASPAAPQAEATPPEVSVGLPHEMESK